MKLLSRFPALVDAYIFLICIIHGRSVKESGLLVAQARFETGDYKSDLARKANNYYGMRVASVRPRTQAGLYTTPGGSTYALYTGIFQSVKDRLLWDTQFDGDHKVVVDIIVGSLGLDAGAVEFVRYLFKRGYFTGDDAVYLAGVVSKVKRIQSTIGPGIIGLFVLCCIPLAVIVYVIKRKKK